MYIRNVGGKFISRRYDYIYIYIVHILVFIINAMDGKIHLGEPNGKIQLLFLSEMGGIWKEIQCTGDISQYLFSKELRKYTP